MRESHKLSPLEIDYESVYEWFDGTIWVELDCGIELCQTAKCCGSEPEGGAQPWIFFLPGELSYLQRKLGHRLPMHEIGDTGTYHCSGSSRCIYGMRPIDCRSYPLWPSVSSDGFSGFLDCRGTRCPISLIPEAFAKRVAEHWRVLFSEHPELLSWFLETFGCTQPDIAL